MSKMNENTIKRFMKLAGKSQKETSAFLEKLSEAQDPGKNESPDGVDLSTKGGHSDQTYSGAKDHTLKNQSTDSAMCEEEDFDASLPDDVDLEPVADDAPEDEFPEDEFPEAGGDDEELVDQVAQKVADAVASALLDDPDIDVVPADDEAPPEAPPEDVVPTDEPLPPEEELGDEDELLETGAGGGRRRGHGRGENDTPAGVSEKDMEEIAEQVTRKVTERLLQALKRGKLTK